MKSVMQHQFSQVPRVEVPRSVFNRSHGYKTTFDSGDIVPFYVDEALPGDSFNLSATIFARMSTPIYPIMDNMFLDVFYFSVPLRLIWDNFQKFMGETVDPYDPESSTDYEVPQIVASSSTGFTVGSLSDYFGLPTGINSLSVASFWHRAYNLIYNEWFRPQDICDSVVVDKDDGPDAITDYVLLKRAKRHDYFTSCLPWPQKGPGVELPLGSSAPVLGIGKVTQVFAETAINAYTSAGSSQTLPFASYVNQATNNEKWLLEGTAASGFPNIRADLSNATAATINSLRQAFQLQRMYERDARGGTRYTEIIRSHFGVVSPDARLQRPEYLGGTTSPVVFSSVPQTSESNTTPQGTLAAYATLACHGAGFTKSFTEHCVVLGLMCVRADLTYQQGLPRMFSRKTRWDFYWPGFAHLGEQAVLNKEIYCQNDANDDKVFGYQERYAEYRYHPSKITGKFRSTYSTPLDAWHLSQEFSGLPTLSPAFINEDVPMARILAVDTEPDFLMDSYIKCNCTRPMPVYSVPGLIDHF